MDKLRVQEPTESVATSLYNLHLNNPKRTPNSTALRLNPQLLAGNKKKVPPSLLSLSLGVVGSNLEEIIDDLAEISVGLPPDIKIALLAIARRRKLLNDDILIALADASWKVIDMSGSHVSDSGLCHVVDICKNLRAVDISRCNNLTSIGVSKLLQQSHSLEILRWGGCPNSESTAHRCLSCLKPRLADVEGDSWEDIDSTEFAYGAQSLRWLSWPKIDKDSLESLRIECPRITVNPKPSSPFGSKAPPKEALGEFALDEQIVAGINPKTWSAVTRFVAPEGIISSRSSSSSASATTNNGRSELSLAEKFRLAFCERDMRLAPKRAKNARQHERRAKKEWVSIDPSAKALALASQAVKSAKMRNL